MAIARSTSPLLGVQVKEHLIKVGVETPMTSYDGQDAHTVIEDSFRDIMIALNLDIEDDSLAETPTRVAKMFLQELFYGLDYTYFPKCTVVENKMHYDEVIQEKCQVKSMCEHHFLPIVGVAHVAYLPRKKVLGLSKINRIVDFFSRRPQIQERLTEQVAHALSFILETDDVAVIIKGEHMCVKQRGVEDTTSVTTTSKLMGRFRAVPELRTEFMALARSD
jgi:GTP cyclohydrolase I